ncbi:MAG: hypothetical protein KIT19_11470 [Phycisphaeraceae bacterium]|nr:hypothetical protein [Phycisphaeraceae bacterium]
MAYGLRSVGAINLLACVVVFAIPHECHAQLCGKMHDLPSPAGGGSALGVSHTGAIIVGHASVWPHGQRSLMWDTDSILTDLTPFVGESMAMGVSDDGRFVVGWRSTAGIVSPYRWRESEGVRDLGVSHAVAWKSSHDGSRVVCYGTIADAQRAYLWTDREGIIDLGVLPGESEAVSTAISPEGSTVVGFSIRNAAPWPSTEKQYSAFRWTAAEGMQSLGTLGGRDSYAYGVSEDGRVIVGSSRDDVGVARAFRWEGGEMSAIGPPNSCAYGVSADGSVVVGAIYGTGNSTSRGFRWTATSGWQDIGTLGGSVSHAWGVSGNGLVIVGSSNDSNGTQSPFRWIAEPSLADYDGDYFLQITDFLDFIDDFGSCQHQPAPCGSFGNPDVNGDTIIDILDFLDFFEAFGQGC